MNAHPLTWRDTLAAGDIVAFRFPCLDEPLAEKPRPCLVVDVDRIAGNAVVVYGTSRWTGPNRGHELHVTGRADCDEASLNRPTRFVGARRVQVPLCCDRFVECRDGTAVLGRLGDSYRPRLDRIRQVNPRRFRRGHLRRPAGGRAFPTQQDRRPA
ncbi:hypothetical protein [Pararhodobacter sp. SW119]|uniref:hypothetical protein n=1 Tax=Pararhodobacter sp. SW119 TaxID=2780075 RepID=UPI001AE02628|nr:hypothetical protein [Pararhodobacter sp. SW119]